MNILVIGGTRNMGYFLVKRLIDAGHRLTILNRGVTKDDLPDTVARLSCDRTDIQQMRRALAGREFDMVIDTVIFKGEEAEAIVNILNGQIGQYIFFSTGQVYLVRKDLEAPIQESDYAGELIEIPEHNTFDYEEWLYGKEKRDVENVFIEAADFPYTSLRMPMVNSERDKFNRLYGYVLRIQDNGPILVPDKPKHPLRHVYAHDVVEAVMKIVESGIGKGRAYNISQDETLPLTEFLDILGQLIGKAPHILEVEREQLLITGLLPDCSPFSESWMSILDNARSKAELGITYTPVQMYLEKIINNYMADLPPKPVSYRRRHVEKKLAESLISN